jgi:predicted small lipoprotein YifL
MSERNPVRGRSLNAFARALVLALSGAIALGGTLSGCGQKGALFLPQQKKSRVPATPSNPAPDETEATPADTPGDTPGSDTPAPTSDVTPPA